MVVVAVVVTIVDDDDGVDAVCCNIEDLKAQAHRMLDITRK